jgi:hypothetical protein
VLCNGCFISQQTGGLLQTQSQLDAFNKDLLETERNGEDIDPGSCTSPFARSFLVVMKAGALRFKNWPRKHFTAGNVTHGKVSGVVESQKRMLLLTKQMYDLGLLYALDGITGI